MDVESPSTGPTGPDQGPMGPGRQPEPTGFSSDFSKELSKKVYTFPETYRLKGPENFDQWKQAFAIMLRAIGYSQFLADPSIANSLSDSDQAILLMLLRDSLSSSPQAAIAWISGPAEAYKLLKDQYSHSMGLQRDSLYREFHSLKYASGTNLAEFNA